MRTTAGIISFLRNSSLYETEKPYLVLLPLSQDANVDKSIPRSNLLYEDQNVDIEDVRGLEEHYRLEECGFQYMRHNTSITSLLGLKGDGPTISDVEAYKSEVEVFLKEFLQATHVVCYDFRIRENVVYDREDIDLRNPLLREGPAVGAHTDVTARSGPEMIINHLNASDCQKFNNPSYRFRIVNTWRSLNPVCEDSPLAFCDYRSVEPKDLIPSDRVIPERAGEVYYLLHNNTQKWAHLSRQTPSELAVFVLYDNKPGPQAKYCPHISFRNPACPPDAPPRRSVETRSIVISPMQP
ncbi:hypothetical protein F4808DRAFT_444098 [Astrocystis sublimbata]|nr:hypothetical protein F4808DRAFT_444098 [Astrocystis sublimbata]